MAYKSKKRPNESTTLDPPPQPKQQINLAKNMSVASASDLAPKPLKPLVEKLAGGSAELGFIERKFSEMQAKGIQPGTPEAEALFRPQKTVDQIRQEVAQQIPSEQSQQLPPPTVNLETPQGIINPTTALTNIPSIAGGAATGAGLGAAAGSIIPVVGTIGGGIAGGIIGGVTAYLGKLAVDRHQITKDAFQVYQSMKLSDTDVLQFAKNKTFPPDHILQIYETNLANTLESQRALRELTKGKTGKELSGAMDELIEVNEYLRQEPIRRQQILLAMQS